ncbi:hypothetical protein J3Q64DRAFT_1694661 [Phycomyces blakesleeanus]|uniref:Uncharacterized protein n=2 Tax=Phycomyces blakesleeanus TaxID=4837 RepID=A0A162Q535_PHYB8|nr:hypothetical protein PHYBLDRAFT_163195 [Phycomyces blakesleeanus NRRL 1555(-)]OAD80156.1 hypothetical protein PHYBLDRAFT_163195 [Phycomyces blakesleeanus NRRL 1555(-)]|eukprot:XP_018298196.1 hypothetical protein PHYBLDRAFT_163195 [Phycomyces blakesleeanus NRRL 1555(-)]
MFAEIVVVMFVVMFVVLFVKILFVVLFVAVVIKAVAEDVVIINVYQNSNLLFEMNKYTKYKCEYAIKNRNMTIVNLPGQDDKEEVQYLIQSDADSLNAFFLTIITITINRPSLNVLYTCFVGELQALVGPR